MRAVLKPGRVAVVTLALLLAGLFALPSPAHAVVKGKKATYGPWAVQMLIDGVPSCTATALSEEWIISAQHCFSDRPDREFSDRQITFRYGSLDVRKAKEVKVIRGSRVDAPNISDVKMIKVQPMKGITPAKLSIKKVKPGTPVRVLGWGSYCSDQDERDEADCQSKVLKQADGRVLRVKTHRERCQVFSGPSGLCASAVTGVPAGGDSGGPMMTIAPKGKERLVGVFWGSDRDSTMGAERVLPIQKWIRKTLTK
jgi:hypothetical protein